MGNIDLIGLVNEGELTLVDTLSAHTSNCHCLKVDSGFECMAVGSADFIVSLWQLDDLICHHTISFEYVQNFKKKKKFTLTHTQRENLSIFLFLV